uniref:Uncharacterized protein n=1 Tax=Arundo donax TaxID=35708 RepID=A0A0A8Z481_ARUDO
MAAVDDSLPMKGRSPVWGA